MKDEKKHIREPFEPEGTPKPPQIIDPEKRDDRRHPVKEDPANRSEEKAGNDEKGHLLSEEADIDDETTI